MNSKTNIDFSTHHNEDKIAKTLFSHQEVALSFFEEYLPQETFQQIDWSTLKELPNELQNQQMHQFLADLIFEVKWKDSGEKAYLTLLWEHQSSVEVWMSFRIHQYMMEIWRKVYKEQKKSRKAHLPTILPFVLYTGDETWKSSTHFEDLIQPSPSTLPHTPKFEFILVDAAQVSQKSLERLAQHAMCQVLLRSLKSGKFEQIEAWNRQYFSFLPDSLQPSIFMYYIRYYPNHLKELEKMAIESHQEGTIQAWEDHQNQLLQTGRMEGELKGKMEGELKGKMEGELKGKMELIDILLTLKNDWSFIEEKTGITQKQYLEFKQRRDN